MGRGIASGGRTCGRGHSGQKSRSGHGIPRGFEGGQTPTHLRVPKSGLRDPHAKEYSLVGLNRIQHLIDTGRIDVSKPITLSVLKLAGINYNKDGVKIVASVTCMLDFLASFLIGIWVFQEQISDADDPI